MTKHEDKIRLLSETALGGPQFKQFIRRHEINIEPPPKEEEKAVEKYVIPVSQSFADTKRVTRSPNVGLRRWGQGRLLEAEEESYFNTDDDDDDVPINLSNAFPKTNNPSLKRKRALSVPSRSQIQRPMPVVIPSLGSLVDYDDGEDLGGFEAAEDPPLSIPHDSSQRIQGSPGPEVPASPKLTNRPITGSKPPESLLTIAPDDPEDSLLESLLSKSEPPARPPPDHSLSAKRRRDDEDDELLAIATKAKRPSMGTGAGVPPTKDTAGGGGLAIKLGSIKTSEEGPKKIKFKLSSPSSTTPSPSSPGVKDGDTG